MDAMKKEVNNGDQDFNFYQFDPDTHIDIIYPLKLGMKSLFDYIKTEIEPEDYETMQHSLEYINTIDAYINQLDLIRKQLIIDAYIIFCNNRDSTMTSHIGVPGHLGGIGNTFHELLDRIKVFTTVMVKHHKPSFGTLNIKPIESNDNEEEE